MESLPDELLSSIMSFLDYDSSLHYWATCKTVRNLRLPSLRLSNITRNTLRFYNKAQKVFVKPTIAMWHPGLWHLVQHGGFKEVDIRFCKVRGRHISHCILPPTTRLCLRLDKMTPRWIKAHVNPSMRVEMEVVGVYYRNGANIDHIKGDEVVEIREEPDNKYDPQARAVYIDGTQFGYLYKKSVPKYEAFSETCPNMIWKTKRTILRRGYIPRIILYAATPL